MQPKKNQNIEMLAVVAKGLGELKEKVAFVGGATIGLYLSDPGTSELRPTDDVDCVVEAASRAKYGELEERLRRLFQSQIEQSPEKVRSYIAKHFKELLADSRFQDVLPGQLRGPLSAGRAERALTIAREIAQLAE